MLRYNNQSVMTFHNLIKLNWLYMKSSRPKYRISRYYIQSKAESLQFKFAIRVSQLQSRP